MAKKTAKKTEKKPAARTAKATAAPVAKIEKPAKKPARRTVTFTLEDAPGRQVFVAGCFTNWEPKHKLTDRESPGVYTAKILLAPGEYQYKFVVDGEWRLDKANPNFVPNDFGTLNSLLRVTDK